MYLVSVAFHDETQRHREGKGLNRGNAGAFPFLRIPDDLFQALSPTRFPVGVCA